MTKSQSMNDVIKELIELVNGKNDIEALGEVEQYFSKITWSIEQEEWKKMNGMQKAMFVRALKGA